MDSVKLPRNYPPNFVVPSIRLFLYLRGFFGPIRIDGVVAMRTHERLQFWVAPSLEAAEVVINSVGIVGLQVADTEIKKRMVVKANRALMDFLLRNIFLITGDGCYIDDLIMISQIPGLETMVIKGYYH